MLRELFEWLELALSVSSLESNSNDVGFDGGACVVCIVLFSTWLEGPLDTDDPPACAHAITSFAVKQ